MDDNNAIELPNNGELMGDVSEFVGELISAFDPDQSYNPWMGDEAMPSSVIGDADAADWWSLQGTDFTCAVVAQKSILNQFGIDVSESQLVFDATSNGWLTTGGTSPDDMGALLEYYGIPTSSYYGNDVNSLVSELAQGHKAIVAVDSSEIWGMSNFWDDWLNPNGADHAVVVTGIDVSNPDDIYVVLNDSGIENGAGHRVPLKDFMDAWEDSGKYFISTDIATPNLSDDMIFGANYDGSNGFYMNPEFWGNLFGSALEGILNGIAAGEATYVVTDDADFAKWTGTVVAAVTTFVGAMDVFEQHDVDQLFYTI